MKENHEFRVIRLRELPLAIPCCDCPGKIYEYWQGNVSTAVWYNTEVETLCAIHLNTRRRATGFHLVAFEDPWTVPPLHRRRLTIGAEQQQTKVRRTT
jgi:hypothetical protein